MKIVVLDGYTLNPGDLSWEGLEPLGEVEVHDRTAPEQVLERAVGAPILFTNKTPLPREVIEELPNLRYIGVLATGYNTVDVEAARRRGITVTNIPTYGTRSVAQMTIALLLHLTNHVAVHSEAVRQGEWSRAEDWSYTKAPILELDGCTLGIVGYGRIGRATAEIASAMGMRIVAHDPSGDTGEVENLSVEALFERSDVVSLHTPLTPDNERMVNESMLRRMKPTALLLNTSRGALIDEPALARALNEGWIAGAGLDVLSQEPPPADHPLLSARNCVITPHVAWASRAARSRLLDEAVANLRAWLEGTPQNVVS